MVTRIMPSDRDLRTLAGIVSQDRPEFPEVGLPLSLLSDLAAQIPCDFLLCHGYDTTQEQYWFTQQIPEDDGEDGPGGDEMRRVFWEQYWDCQVCSYPDRSGDLRSVVKVHDFYSVRQWHSSGFYREVVRPQGFENHIGLFLSGPPGPDAGPGRTVRLFFLRGPGPDFTERDRAILTLLRPHLHQAFLDAERRRSPVPELTPRQWELMRLIAAGRTNIQIARQLGLSEGTVRTHLENIYSRLDVSNRTAAVLRAFPEAMARGSSASA
ncbi:MAG TPA: response regulator transcription factor [Acidimicrobiales bacterium]|nr:response regulator transcription factor [Acidimicrobiales bacterium]